MYPETSRLKILFALLLLLMVVNPLQVAGFETYSFGGRKVILYTVEDGLPRNIITCFSQDQYGYGWVGTKNGLAQFDGYSFHSYDSLAGENINGLIIDRNNDLWVSANKGLFRYDRLHDRFLYVQKGYAHQLTLSGDTVFFLLGKKLWKIANRKPETTPFGNIGCYTVTDRGIWYCPNSGLGGIKNTFSQEVFLKGKTFDLIKQVGAYLFAATPNGSIYVIEGDTLIKRVTVDNHHPVHDIEAFHSQIWIATDGNGIFVLDKQLHPIDHFIEKTGKESLIPSNTIYDIYTNGQNMLWLATYGTGLLCIIEEEMPFINLLPDHAGKNSLVAKEGSAVYIEGWKYILGTNYGISIWNRKKGHFRNIPADRLYKELKGTKVRTILKGHKGTFLIGTYDGLAGEYSEDFRFLRAFAPTGSDLGGMQKIVSGFDLGGKSFLFASLNKERFLVRYDLDKDRSSLVKFPDSKKLRQVMSIRKNHLGQIVALINRSGLYQYLPKENILYNLAPEINKKLSNEVLNDFYQDPQGNYWIATRNKGLLKYSQGGALSARWDVNHGLPTNTLLRLESVDNKDLWISSIAGIIKLNMKSGQVQVFNTRHGLACNEFSPRTSAITPDGNILFGCSKGFVIVEPRKVKVDTSQVKVIISDILFQNKSIKSLDDPHFLKVPLEETRELVLPYKRNSFTIKFFTKDNHLPKYNNFAYRLKGLEDEWIYLGESNHTTYTSLPPGTYVFEVKSTNKSNIWQERPTRLTIVILPPWYKTWWAYLMYLVMILSIIGLVFNFYKKRLKLKMELDLAKYKAKHEHEVTEKKIGFFASIAHDLKTIATLIAGPLSDLLENGHFSNEQLKKLNIIKRNTERLYKLNTDLLEFRKITQNQLPLKVKETEIAPVVNTIFESFVQRCEKKGIDYTIHNEITEKVFVDPKKVEKILWNLISNAVKYTDKGGKIHIEVKPGRLNECKALKIIVTDTGKGIDKEHLEKIFDRFYQVSQNESPLISGVGLGLFIVKELVNLHHGEIRVASIPGKGSAFTVLLPVDESCYQESEKADSPEETAPLKEGMPEMPETQEEQKNEQEKNKKKYNRHRIVIVEDNEELRNYLTDHFSQENTVFSAPNGKEGLDLIKKKNPDIVISDIKMPLMNGYELCDTIKNDFNLSHIPVVLLTANETLDEKVKGMYVGADSYITKPFDIHYLDAVVHSLLANRQKLREKFLGLEPVKNDDTKTSEKEIAFINELKRFILDNLSEPDLNIDQLVKHFAVSRSQLNRKIKAVTGMTPNHYIKTLRLKKAYELLKDKNSRVSEVAYQVGFSDPNYFTICFKKEFGENPSQVAN